MSKYHNAIIGWSLGENDVLNPGDLVKNFENGKISYYDGEKHHDVKIDTGWYLVDHPHAWEMVKRYGTQFFGYANINNFGVISAIRIPNHLEVSFHHKCATCEQNSKEHGLYLSTLWHNNDRTSATIDGIKFDNLLFYYDANGKYQYICTSIINWCDRRKEDRRKEEMLTKCKE